MLPDIGHMYGDPLLSKKKKENGKKNLLITSLNTSKNASKFQKIKKFVGVMDVCAASLVGGTC